MSMFIRGERDFRFWDWDWDLGCISLGLKAWDQPVESPVSVSMFETTNQKSQYQSHSLRQKAKSLGISLKYVTGYKKSQSWSQQNCWSYKFINVPWKCLTLILEVTIFRSLNLNH